MKVSSRLALTWVLFLALAPNAWAVTGASAVQGVSPSPPAVTGSAEPTRSVIVGFGTSGESQAIDSARRLGAKSARRAKSGGLAVVQVPPGVDVTDFVAELNERPGVQYAEPDGLVYETVIPDDQYFPQQWGLAKMGAPAAWDITSGASVKVAVIDSGVDLTHPDLVGRIDTVNDWDFVHRTDTAQDDDGHGTHVAGIVGATTGNGTGVAGVAGECTILPIKVTTSAGTGSTSDVAAGIRWAADHGADVINLSLGSTQSSLAIAAAVRYAVERDCVVVAASGNEGSSSVYYPAAGDDVVGVGSTDRQDVRSGFSNYGPGVDIVAPGSEIISTWLGGGYLEAGGTSMATPYVAGVAALIRAKNPAWTRTMVERQLLGTALDLGAIGRDNYYGYGRLQADRAVGATVNAGTLTGVVYFRGRPLVGATVSVPDRPAVLTAGDGSYTVQGVTPSAYVVSFGKKDFTSQTAGVSIPDGGTVRQDVALRRRVFMSTPRVVGSASARRGTVLKGTKTPARSKRMTVQVRRLVNHRWKAYRTRRVTAKSSGAWRATLKLKRGRYSIRAVSAGDSAYAPGVSKWRTVVVR